MPKANKQIIVDEIIKGIENGSIEWLSEYITNGNIYKINPPHCANRINPYGYYVYALIDPFSGKIFYIGKGKGKRAFDHFSENNKNNTQKRDKIKDIYRNGDKAIVWILEHNLDENSAIDLEALLINVLPELTNITIPSLKETNIWNKGNITTNGMVEAECTEYDTSQCETMNLEELIDLMAVVVTKGHRVDQKQHRYFLGINHYDFTSTIHLLPARLRNVKAISFSDYFDKQMSYAKK